MSKDKAKAFIQYLKEHPEVMEKMQGFTQEEFKQAAQEHLDESGGNIEPHYPI